MSQIKKAVKFLRQNPKVNKSHARHVFVTKGEQMDEEVPCLLLPMTFRIVQKNLLILLLGEADCMQKTSAPLSVKMKKKLQ